MPINWQIYIIRDKCEINQLHAVTSEIPACLQMIYAETELITAQEQQNRKV